MTHDRSYEVLLLPTMEIAQRFCTLREADAWMRSYNEVSRGPTIAVVAEDRQLRREIALQSVMLRRR